MFLFGKGGKGAPEIERDSIRQRTVVMPAALINAHCEESRIGEER